MKVQYARSLVKRRKYQLLIERILPDGGYREVAFYSALRTLAECRVTAGRHIWFNFSDKEEFNPSDTKTLKIHKIYNGFVYNIARPSFFKEYRKGKVDPDMYDSLSDAGRTHYLGRLERNKHKEVTRRQTFAQRKRTQFQLLIEKYDPENPDLPYEEVKFFDDPRSVFFYQKKVWEHMGEQEPEFSPMYQSTQKLELRTLKTHKVYKGFLYQIAPRAFITRYRRGGINRKYYLGLTERGRRSFIKNVEGSSGMYALRPENIGSELV